MRDLRYRVRREMDSLNENVNTQALTQLRSWADAGTSLELILTNLSARFAVPMSLIDVSDSELRFVWSQVSPSNVSPFLVAEGTLTIRLSSASLTLSDSSSTTALPNASVTIHRGASMCIIRPHGI
jgi:hypothetical protein